MIRVIHLRQNSVSVNGPKILFYRIYLSEKSMEVKYKALIDTVLWGAAVQHSVSDEKKISGVSHIFLIINS